MDGLAGTSSFVLCATQTLILQLDSRRKPVGLGQGAVTECVHFPGITSRRPWKKIGWVAREEKEPGISTVLRQNTCVGWKPKRPLRMEGSVLRCTMFGGHFSPSNMTFVDRAWVFLAWFSCSFQHWVCVVNLTDFTMSIIIIVFSFRFSALVCLKGITKKQAVKR